MFFKILQNNKFGLYYIKNPAENKFIKTKNLKWKSFTKYKLKGFKRETFPLI